jgi:hypothetical protein
MVYRVSWTREYVCDITIPEQYKKNPDEFIWDVINEEEIPNGYTDYKYTDTIVDNWQPLLDVDEPFNDI